MKKKKLSGPIMELKFIVLACITVLSVGVMADNSKINAKDVQKFVSEVEQKRQEKLDASRKLLEEANKLITEQKYNEAEKKLIEAKAALQGMAGSVIVEQNNAVEASFADLKEKWGNEIYNEAKNAFLDKNYKEAIFLAKHAIQTNDKLKDKAKEFIDKCTKYIAAENYNQKTDLLTIDPENEKRAEDINLLYRHALILYKNQMYDRVRENLEKILIKDPYNDKATFLLKKVYDKLYQVARMRRENEMLERVAEIEWKWNEGVLPTDTRVPEDKEGPKEETEDRTSLYYKLQSIVFPNIDFEEASISSVITHLSERSKQLDPDKAGVSIILNMKPENMAKLPKVTMSFDKIPMSEIIRYLCQASGLKYRVEDRAVIIGVTGIDDMERQFFKVRASLIKNIVPGVGDGEGGEDGEGDMMDEEGDVVDLTEFGSTGDDEESATPKTATAEALKAYFTLRGIPFPAGSTIAYDRRAGKLIVKNTPENLRKFENLLRDIDITTPLVLIEAKILEILETDMEELGFDWVFSEAGGVLANKQNQAWFVDTTEKILRNYQDDTVQNSTVVGSSPFQLINDLQVLPNFGHNNEYNLALSVYAVDQSGRGETLSSPKVIATSGTTATIRMVQEMFFPESWTEPEISVTDNIITYTPTYPEFGEAQDVGIRFEVTPTVHPNKYTISLNLNPQVVSLTGWTVYTYDVVLGAGGNGAIDTQALVRMPEITRRDLNTNIKVYDGETVVLGGMLRDDTVSRSDKWPGLGEIPLLGRLFRSNYDNSQKRNLLIFVTTRLLNNDGVPVRPDALRGVPEFHR